MYALRDYDKSGQDPTRKAKKWGVTSPSRFHKMLKQLEELEVHGGGSSSSRIGGGGVQEGMLVLACRMAWHDWLSHPPLVFGSLLLLLLSGARHTNRR